MQTYPADEIRVAIVERQRKIFNEPAQQALVASILNYGLFHPIVCSRYEDGLLIVAGERRWRAIMRIYTAKRTFRHNDEPVPPGEIPYILIEDTDAIRLREIELEENIQREDLSWQERTAALDELHKLRTVANPEQTVSDTAKEIASNASGASHRSARREIARAQIIAPHLDDPAIANAQSPSAAFSIIARKVEGEFTAELVRRGLGKKSFHTLLQGKLEDHITQLPSDHFTCLIVDPPYGMGADQFGDIASQTHQYADDRNEAMRLIGHLALSSRRITRSEAHLYIFCDIELFIPIRDMIDSQADWNVWRTPIIWSKGNTGFAPSGISGLRRSYELILWAKKGNKPFGQVHKDVIEVSNVQNKQHAAQKPVDLYSTLLRRSCLPGDFVLDPCCGCGTIFPAATQANVTATGIELNKSIAQLARVRLEE